MKCLSKQLSVNVCKTRDRQRPNNICITDEKGQESGYCLWRHSVRLLNERIMHNTVFNSTSHSFVALTRELSS